MVTGIRAEWSPANRAARSLVSAITVILAFPALGACSNRMESANQDAVLVVRGQQTASSGAAALANGSSPELAPKSTTTPVAIDDGAPSGGWQADEMAEASTAWKRARDPYRVEDSIASDESGTI